MNLEFDFRLHRDPSTMEGTQYFEFLPGQYRDKCWNAGARFLHEYTFSLIEGVFERHIPKFDHWAFVEAPRSSWSAVCEELEALLLALEASDGEAPVLIPYGRTLRTREEFERSLVENQRALAQLLVEFIPWLKEVLATEEMVSILGI